MHILHLIHQYMPDYVGGTEFYTQSLAHHQTDQGASVAIFVPAYSGGDWPEPTIEDGVKVYRYEIDRRDPRRVFFDLFGQEGIDRAFKSVLLKEKPDIVHIQHLMGLPISLVEQLIRHQIPYLITLHDYWYYCANAQLLTNYDKTICNGPLWGLNCGRCAIVRAGKPSAQVAAPIVAPIMVYRNKKTTFALANAKALIAPTHFVSEVYTKLGTAADKIKVIPHGIKLPNGIPPRSKLRNGILDVVYIGGISWQKGIHILIQAFNQLPANQYRLRIYGDESSFPAYSKQLHRLASHPNISFAGQLPHEELWQTLAAADVVVVPTLWYETSSLIIQEAFAVGVPVVASDIGVIRERIVEGQNGLHFPPGDIDALRDILSQLHLEPKRLAELSANIGPVRSVEEHAQDILDLYQTIVTASDH